MILKVSKKAVLISSIGVFLVALGILGWSGLQKVDEKSQLEKQLTTAQTRLQGIQLDSLSSQPEELEKQQNQIVPELELVKAELSHPVNSTNATVAVFDAARANDLVVTEITTSRLASESVQGVNLSAIMMTTKVEGKLSKMAGFIATLNNHLKASVIKSVEIEVPEVFNADNTTVIVISGDITTATIDLVFYTYRGE